MKIAYITILLFIFICVFFCAVKMRKLSNDYTNRVFFRFIVTNLFVTMFYASAILVNHYMQALVLYSFYYVFLDLMVLYMLLFTNEYVQNKKSSKKFRIALNLFFLIDSIGMLTNVFHHLSFGISKVADHDGHMFYRVVSRKMLFNIHLVYLYLISALIIILLIRKAKQTSKVYKDKYYVVLLIFIFALTTNILYMVYGYSYDISIVSYGIADIAIFYFIYYYKPYHLVENLFSFIIKNNEAAILCFDINQKCIHANDLARKIFRVSNRKEVFEAYFKNAQDEGKIVDNKATSWNEVREIDGKKCYCEVKFQVLFQQGRFIGSCITIEDQTTQIAQINKNKYRAAHDTLTDIYNRDYFYEHVAAFLATTKKTYYMVCTDVRNFKMINDIYGEEKGDEILIKISKMLKQLLTGEEFCCRLQGDRFAICMPKEKFNEEDFVNKIRHVSKVIGTNISINMYVGVYEITDPTMEVSVMCDRANLAINSVKNNYQGVVVYYDDALRKNVIKEQQAVNSFSDALAAGQFQVYLQPQMAVDKSVHGAEALVRWLHPDDGVILPQQFVDIYEKTGLISRLDMYVWDKACSMLASWQAKGYVDNYISVNISTKDFYYLDLYDVFTGLVEKYKIDPKRLHLEITETAIMSDMKSQTDLIGRLQKYGFMVEMDDFGSGYSSLNMLSELTVDTIKIDMGFLRNSNMSERSKEIIRAVIELSKELGMHIVTEGVETEEQYDMLLNMGSDLFQGFYFSKPMKASEFERAYILK